MVEGTTDPLNNRATAYIMMRLHLSRRRMVTLFFVAIYVIKSFPRVIFKPLASFSSLSLMPQQQQRHEQKQANNITMTMEATQLLADCQERVLLLSPAPPSRPPARINMTLRRGYLAQNLYHKFVKCGSPSSSLSLNSTNSTQQRYMHPSMKNTPGVLDFTTILSTDLKLLVMGDSVAIQISQTLEEMLGAKPEHRHVYRYTSGANEGIHISAPIRGGGVVAGWRLLGMLLKDNVHRKLPNVGPGWRMQDVYNVTHHAYNATNDGKQQKQKQQTETSTTRQEQVVGSFDVLLFHIPIGWIKDYDSINNDTLMETVLLAGELFGVATVVFNVPSFTNNILTAQHLQSLRAAQNRVVAFANDFVPPPKEESSAATTTSTTTTVRHVLALRMDRLMDETMEWNARLMGMTMTPNTTDTTTSTTATNTTTTTTVSDKETEDDWRLVPLGRPIRKGKTTRFIHHVAQSCATLPRPEGNNKPTSCTPNYISRDGMHICMETMGGRFFAGLGCVLGCVYNYNNVTDNHHSAGECQQEKDHVLSCANACNDRYLSLRSVANEVVE